MRLQTETREGLCFDSSLSLAEVLAFRIIPNSYWRANHNAKTMPPSTRQTNRWNNSRIIYIVLSFSAPQGQL